MAQGKKRKALDYLSSADDRQLVIFRALNYVLDNLKEATSYGALRDAGATPDDVASLIFKRLILVFYPLPNGEWSAWDGPDCRAFKEPFFEPDYPRSPHLLSRPESRTAFSWVLRVSQMPEGGERDKLLKKALAAIVNPLIDARHKQEAEGALRGKARPPGHVGGGATPTAIVGSGPARRKGLVNMASQPDPAEVAAPRSMWEPDELLSEDSQKQLGRILAPEIAEKCRTIGDAITALKCHLPTTAPTLMIDTETVEGLKCDLEAVSYGADLYEHLKGKDEWYAEFLPEAVRSTLERARAIRERQPRAPAVPVPSGDPRNSLTILLDWCTSALSTRAEAKTGKSANDLAGYLPMARQELEILQDLTESTVPPIVAKQAEGILALIANGQYEGITPAEDGSLFARTSNILIEHDDWVFELGRYEINIDATGKVTILSSDGIDADGYPHPHVDSNGKPCWGNVGADLAKAIGRMRVFEALTLLYDFVASYNEDGPFIKIGKFDDNYDDPDENPCEDCEDYHSPYCICECSHNDGMHCCSDCGEYRTDYCYTECSYNIPGFQYMSPCDDCEENEAYCFLECQHNDEWQVNSPCNDCEKKACKTCKYLAKKRELASHKQPAAAS